VNEPARLEAFSDGVLAIAITLLVLDLNVHPEAGESLAHALVHAWPSYFAYIVSFMIIGIIWVNHHSIFTLVVQVDRLVLFANLLLLLVVAAIPFPTRLLAEHLTDDNADAHVASAVYCATMLAMSVSFSLLWLAVTRRPEMLRPGYVPGSAFETLRRFGLGMVVYTFTIGLSFVSAPLTLVVVFALSVYYCFDQVGISTTPAT
jgi:uncharacterized membrane protein